MLDNSSSITQYLVSNIYFINKASTVNKKNINNSCEDILAFVLVGGEGRRLLPLTESNCKPSVAFGMDNCIVDFVISNLINSGINKIYLVAQYKPASLLSHINEKWNDHNIHSSGFIEVIDSNTNDHDEMYMGTADAVYKNIDKIYDHNIKHVAVFSADHIYRMNVQQMFDYHLDVAADVTISTISVPVARASSLGVLKLDDNNQITEFYEKPDNPVTLPGSDCLSQTSMGNYIFTKDILLQVHEISRYRADIDFGHDVIGWLIKVYSVYSYDFKNNKIPGLQDYEDPTYWYDVGTLGTYWQAYQDLLGYKPKLKLDNPLWPIGKTRQSGERVYDNCLVSYDARYEQALIKNSIIRSNVILEKDVVVEDSILLGDVTIKSGARIKNTIIDQYNVIRENEHIGYDVEKDKARYFIDDSGIVVVASGSGEPGMSVQEFQGIAYVEDERYDSNQNNTSH